MPGMQSAAMTLLLEAGSATDPQACLGSATVLSDLVLRGAGQRDSRQLTDYLDGLGLQRSSSVGVYHTRFASAGVGPKVLEALGAYADIVQRARLPQTGFLAARDLALQSLAGIEDEPHHKLLIKLREWHFPSPLGRNSMGQEQDLQKLTVDLCHTDYARRYQASGAILALAGNIDFQQILPQVAQHFGTWPDKDSNQISLSPPPGNYHHEHHPSEQTQIGIAYPSLPETHQDYYAVRMAVEVLSGGMSARLFTEIREKRALCYSVGAGYGSLKGIGSVLGYAGTSNDRAQATLDCFLAQLHRLSQGVSEQELARAKIGLKANTIMQQESTGARCASIAHDYFMRGRIRTLEEITTAIDDVTVHKVNAHLRNNPPGPFTIVTVGPKELKVP
jgi:predicted Zn-dependent peptidase